jgi:hypothetical protein
MPIELDSKEWLDAPLNRAMRAEIAEAMRREGISERNDPEGFHAELKGRLVPLMDDVAWREAVKEKLQRRLGSVPTRESLEGSVKHNLYMNKMLTSSVVAFGAAVSSALACRFGELVNAVEFVGVLGSTFLNWKLCEFWYHRREANEYQNLDILFNEARKADTLEKKLAFTGALYHIISKHGLEKGWLGEILPHYKEKFDWRGNERFECLTSSLQKLQEAGRFVAEELIRTGNSLETEVGVDRRFDQKMADFELDLKEIKKHWAERPDSALSAAKLGWIGGIVYTAYTFGEFLIANGY